MRRVLPEIHSIAFGLLAWLSLQTQTHACGLTWEEPKSFFDQIDFQGHVHIVNKIGELDTGKVKLPIYLIFNSSNGYQSPYSGILEIPLLSARMEQVDEDTYLFRSPAGWLLPFRRNSEAPDILDGSAGMKAKVEGDTITAWSECGAKITFLRARITQLHLKEAKLDYVYRDGRVTEIREGENVLLRVNSDSQTGEVQGITLKDNQVIHFTWGQKPLVHRVHGKPTIIVQQRTLSKVSLPDGREKTFEFGVDDQMRPTLKLDGKEEMNWDFETRLAHKVNGWTYEIKPGGDQFANAAIKRINKKGETEFWHCNNAIGKEYVQTIDGVKLATSWFASGKLAGRLKEILKESPQGTTSRSKFYYDENGNLIRHLRADKCIETYERDSKDKSIKSVLKSPEGVLLAETYWKIENRNLYTIKNDFVKNIRTESIWTVTGGRRATESKIIQNFEK